MANHSKDVKRAHLGMLIWAVIVGLSFPIVGRLSDGLPPLLLTAIRFVIAALAIWPLVRRAPDRWPSPRGLLLYAVMGLCLAGFFGAMFWAAHRVTALSMATLYVSVPLLSYCMGRSLGVERRAVRMPAALMVGALGALALIWAQTGGQLGSLHFGFGEALYFAGCMASALYPVLSKWGLNKGWLSRRASLRTFWSLAVGALLITALGLVTESPGSLAEMRPSDILILVYLGLISSGLTFWLLQRAMIVLTPGSATAYTYLVPFVSMMLLFIEQPRLIGWRWLPGSVLVALAIAALLRRDSKRQDKPQPLQAASPTRSERNPNTCRR